MQSGYIQVTPFYRNLSLQIHSYIQRSAYIIIIVVVLIIIIIIFVFGRCYHHHHHHHHNHHHHHLCHHHHHFAHRLYRLLQGSSHVADPPIAQAPDHHDWRKRASVSFRMKT